MQPKLKLSELLNKKGNDSAECPFCKGQETRLHALFGSQLSTSQYYCEVCRVVFERIKWEPPLEENASSSD